MGGFLPYAGANSVQEVIFGVHFQQPQGLGNIDQLMAATKTELPEFQQFNPIYLLDLGVDISSTGIGVSPVPQPSSNGFEFSILGQDKKPERTVRYARGLFTVHFAKYNGWNNVLPASLRYVRELALGKVDLAANPVVAVSLRFIDTYTYTGDKNEACAQFLFKRNTSYIAAHCFETKGAWHSNIGWFDARLEDCKILNQLSIENRITDENAVVTADHNGVCQFRSPRESIPEIDGASASGAGLEGILNKLHAGNKLVLQSILLDDMLQRIGVAT